MSHDDIALCYAALDKRANLGLGCKRFGGGASMAGGVNTATGRIAVDETVALL